MMEAVSAHRPYQAGCTWEPLDDIKPSLIIYCCEAHQNIISIDPRDKLRMSLSKGRTEVNFYTIHVS